jgi:cysteine synthase B
MITDALASGRLAPGMTLIDSTSGNTGIAYAWIGAALGVKVALVMPLNVSVARKRITQLLGAELIYSDPMEQSDGAIRMVRKLVAESPGRYFYPDQYSNPGNPGAHFDGTGAEIWAQTEGRVTHFVAGIGTGGTVMGTGRRLKRENPKVQVIAVEPLEPLHGLEGLKHMPSSLVPDIYREAELDRKLSISTDAGWAMTERLAHEEGVFVGHSAGAAVAGAMQVAAELDRAGEHGVVVTVLCDRADRYFEPMRWDETSKW